MNLIQKAMTYPQMEADLKCLDRSIEFYKNRINSLGKKREVLIATMNEAIIIENKIRDDIGGNV